MYGHERKEKDILMPLLKASHYLGGLDLFGVKRTPLQNCTVIF